MNKSSEMEDQALVPQYLTPAETAAIGMVLDGLPSEHSRRAYERALSLSIRDRT